MQLPERIDKEMEQRKEILGSSNKYMSIQELKKIAREVRCLILETTHHAGHGHVGGSLSEADILTVLFFRIMNRDISNLMWKDRDRFILSKGHATPGYYAVLAKRGYFPVEELKTFDQMGSRLQAHPDMHKCPGVDISTGSLGQGLSCGVGMALGCRANGGSWKTWVLLGDGEMQEGQVWEALMFAGNRRLPGIIAVIDYNKVQLASSVKEAVDLEPLTDKFIAFHWQVHICNGHNMDDLVKTFLMAQQESEDGPVAVIAHTVKGKGVSFMEHQWAWHGKAPDDEQFRLAIKEICENEE
ncbi:MAG: transketolase [Spirochaetota bacterium]